MAWASKYIKELQSGNTVEFRPTGGSMTPHIRSGQLVTVAPLLRFPRVGDIVLCTVNGNQYLHFVKDVDLDSEVVRWQIGNAHGRINGWITFESIHGILTNRQ